MHDVIVFVLRMMTGGFLTTAFLSPFLINRER